MTRLVLFLLSLILFVGQAFAQQMFHNDDYTALYLMDAQRNRGFEVRASLTAVFTTGVADRSGFRLGAGLSLSKYVDDWKFTVGADTYKAKEAFGLGLTYAGVNYNVPNFGASYYLTKYYQEQKQVSGLVSARVKDFEVSFEDDILSLPFTRFIIYDRYRSAALEFRYKHFLVGTNVFTTEANGLTDASLHNRKGYYKEGYKISSPIYVGYTNKNMVVRYGYNSCTVGGYVAQDFWHRMFFDTGEFKNGTYNNQFFQIGTYKPYTLY